MAYFDWSDDFDICVNEMNSQHKVLMEIMNRLYVANEKKAPKAEIAALLSELGAYTIKHFSEEEKFMESVKFDGISTHKVIHKDLLSKFTDHKSNFENGSSPILSKDFFGFLKIWLMAHIQGIDKKYGVHVTKSKAA